MLEALGLLFAGLLLLALGGDSIVKSASGLAQRFGASPFVAGLLLISFATSLPELAVNARAVFTDDIHLALGNAVGSNIANLGLTLGVAALAAPLLLRMRLLSPWLVLLAAATLALIVFGFDGSISRIEGGVLLLGYVAMLAFVLVRGRRESAEVQQAIADATTTPTGFRLGIVRFAIAAALLYFGAKYVVQAAGSLGEAWGWTPLLVGLLPVAIGTALPEVAAAIAAARRGRGDVVAGHVIGSSLFNLLVVVGGMAAYRPLSLPESFVRLELPAAIAFVLVLYPLLRGDLRISRVEGGVLVAAFAGWVALELLLI